MCLFFKGSIHAKVGKEKKTGSASLSGSVAGDTAGNSGEGWILKDLVYCIKVFGLILKAVGSQKKSLSGEVTQSDFSLTKITLAEVWRMKSRGGKPRGRKTGTVYQGAVMRKQGGGARGCK